MAQERGDELNISDGEYDENADEDFNPAAAAEDEGVSSSSDDEGTQQPTKSRKRKAGTLEVELDSGDEATIQERQKRKKKRKVDKDVDEDEGAESGGEGGFVRTRAQRFREKQEKKQQRRGPREGQVTVDVDALWADLSAIPVGRAAAPLVDVAGSADGMDIDGEANKENAIGSADDPLITIKRRVEYAGEVTEVEEQVPRSSKEAQAYLAEHPEADPDYKSNGSKLAKDDQGLQRPLRRPSMFEPNPTGLVKGVDPTKLRLRTPSRIDVLMAEKRLEAERKKKAERVTTMGKSALDWKAFVQEEGLGEEMEKYKKSRGGFLEREDFLGRAQWAQEMRGRDARLKG